MLFRSNRPLLFDADFNPKPAHRAVQATLALAAPRFFDCNRDRVVTIDELLLGVNIALDVLPLALCPPFDPGRNGNVTIEELVAAVDSSLAD